MRKLLAVLISAALLVSIPFGCRYAAKQRLRAKIDAKESTRELMQRQLATQQIAFTALESRIRLMEADMRAYDGEVEAYIMDHKLASGCLAAAATSLSDDNAYSESVKNVATAGAVVCAGLLFVRSGFTEEVAALGDKLVQADVHMKNLRSQVVALRKDLAAQQSGIEKTTADIDAASKEITSLRQELERL